MEKDGSLSSIEIIRSPHSGLSETVMKAVKKMPKWIPGMQNGKAVRVRFITEFVSDSF